MPLADISNPRQDDIAVGRDVVHVDREAGPARLVQAAKHTVESAPTRQRGCLARCDAVALTVTDVGVGDGLRNVPVGVHAGWPLVWTG